MNVTNTEISILVGILSPVIVGLMAWGGMRAELRQLNVRVKQVEDSLLQLLLKHK